MMYVYTTNKANVAKTKEHELRIYTGHLENTKGDDKHIFGFGIICKIASTEHIEHSMCSEVSKVSKVLAKNYWIRSKAFNLNQSTDYLQQEFVSNDCCPQCRAVLYEWLINKLPGLLIKLNKGLRVN